MTIAEIAPHDAAPVGQAARIQSIDVLRGVAILGILVMNVQAFVMPMAAYSNPTAFGTLEGRHYWVWYVSHLLFDMKFMSIFSMLFGAGVILLTSRLEQTGLPAALIHYRRTIFLLLIGMAHAYLLWYGDILVLYALCALYLYPMRRLKPTTLVAIGVVFLAIPSYFNYMGGRYMQQEQARIAASEVSGSQAAVIDEGASPDFHPTDDQPTAAGDPQTPDENKQHQEELENAQQFLQEMEDGWSPSAEKVAEESQAMRGSWTDEITYRAPMVFGFMHLMMIPFWGIWRAGGLMLIGMALFKSGCFSAKWKARTYLAIWIGGWAVGLPVIAHGVRHSFATDWSQVDFMLVGSQFNYWGSVPAALGWIGLVMFVCSMVNPAMHWLTQALSAVGQTALSNYLLHTIVFTTLANGRGLGYFGQIDRAEQAALVVATWIVQLMLSHWYVRHCRFGPAEWLWRSLTYWDPQPMRQAHVR